MLSQKQLTVLIIFGLVFWAAFALLTRSLPMVFNAGGANAILYVASIPVGWVLVSFTQWLADLEPNEVVPGVALAFAVPFLLDGVVFTWFEWVYGQTAVHVRSVAAYILYGAGVTINMAIFRRQTNRL